MPSFIAILLYIGLAELIRRCCFILILAFTGPLSKIPGPLLNKLTPLTWIIKNIQGDQMNLAPKLFKEYGDVVRVGPRTVLVAGKSGIQKILVDEDFRKSTDYEAIRPDPHITNLITETDKSAYRQKRRLLSPGFAISYLNGLEPLMQECIQEFVRVLDSRCADSGGSATVDISRMLGNLTSDVMSATSFGGSFGLVRSDDSKFKEMFMDRVKRAAIDAQFPFVKYLPFIPPIQSKMNDISDEVIAKRRAQKGANKKDLVQIFVDTNEANPVAFSDKHVQEEMALFMIAGSDTTSATATFTLLLLLNNQDKLRALKKEIDESFPSLNAAITFAKTQDLPYLNAVINESMRVMPIVTGGLPRLTTQTTVLCNYEIPEGTVVAAFISEMMKDPRIWPDPDDFIPERWLHEYKGVEADRKAFMPFSAGSRNCIGQQFAMKELRLILATLLRRYELSLIPGQSHELRVHTIPWFTQGYYKVGFKPRS